MAPKKRTKKTKTGSVTVEDLGEQMYGASRHREPVEGGPNASEGVTTPAAAPSREVSAPPFVRSDRHATWNSIGVLVWRGEKYDPKQEAPPHRTALACNWTKDWAPGDFVAADAVEVLTGKTPQNGLPTCGACAMLVELGVHARDERLQVVANAEWDAEKKAAAKAADEPTRACPICELVGTHEEVCPNAQATARSSV